MKKIVLITAFAFVTMLFTADTSTAQSSLSGKWSLVFDNVKEGPGVPVYLVLKQSGKQKDGSHLVDGTYIEGGREYALSGVFSEGLVQFSYEINGKRVSHVGEYPSYTVGPDKIRGELQSVGSEKFRSKWTASRLRQ